LVGIHTGDESTSSCLVHIFSQKSQTSCHWPLFWLPSVLVWFSFTFQFGHNGYQIFEIHHNGPSHLLKPDNAQFNPVPLLTPVVICLNVTRVWVRIGSRIYWTLNGT
jgi:hypothetical protein